MVRLLFAVTFVPIGDDAVATDFTKSSSIGDAVVYLYKIALAVGAILAFFRIGYAGFVYMTSDIWKTKSSMKDILGNAIFGLILLFAIYLILNQIDPRLINLDYKI